MSIITIRKGMAAVIRQESDITIEHGRYFIVNSVRVENGPSILGGHKVIKFSFICRHCYEKVAGLNFMISQDDIDYGGYVVSVSTNGELLLSEQAFRKISQYITIDVHRPEIMKDPNLLFRALKRGI
jgi:hypothetical protein